MKSIIKAGALAGITLLLMSCEEEAVKNKVAVFETNAGVFKIELFENKMPITTKNFIGLAEKGFYDRTKFHRVIEGFMIQGGDPRSKNDADKAVWGTGGPGYNIEDEFAEGLSNIRGTIAMANTGQPNSGGSQFFINVADNTFLDGKHPVFGRIVDGMDVIEEIVSVQTDAQDRPAEDIVVKKIMIQ